MLGIDTVIISVQKENYYIISIYGINSSKVTAVNNANDINYINVTTDRNSRIYYSITSYANATNWTSTRNQSATTSISFGSGSQLRTDYLFISKTLGNDLFTGPWQNKTILDLDNRHFTYARSELNELIDLNGSYPFSNQAEQILFVYNPFSGDEINEADSVITGYLWDADEFDYAIFTTYRYDYATKQFRYSGETWNSRNIGAVHDDMIWVEFKAKDYGIKLIPDTILHTEFIPKTNKFNNVHADFYIRSPHSVIRNGILYPRGDI